MERARQESRKKKAAAEFQETIEIWERLKCGEIKSGTSQQTMADAYLTYSKSKLASTKALKVLKRKDAARHESAV